MLPSGVAARTPATVAVGDRDPRGRRARRRRRGGCGLSRLVRRRDGDDRLPGWRPRDLLGRKRGVGLDCFVDVPSGTVRRPSRCRCRSARSSSTTRSGRARARCRAFQRGLERACARVTAVCPWPRVVEPARRARGVTMPPAHAACLAMLAPGLHDAAETELGSTRRRGRPLETGEDCSTSPGSSPRSSSLAAEGAGAAYTEVRSPRLCSAVEGSACSTTDLERYEAPLGARRPSSHGRGHGF